MRPLLCEFVQAGCHKEPCEAVGQDDSADGRLPEIALHEAANLGHGTNLDGQGLYDKCETEERGCFSRTAAVVIETQLRRSVPSFLLVSGSRI